MVCRLYRSCGTAGFLQYGMSKSGRIKLKLFLAVVIAVACVWLMPRCSNISFSAGDIVYDQHYFDSIIKKTSAKYGIDSRLVKAVIYQESRFNPGRKGKAGEIGLMQLLPRGAVADWARITKNKMPSEQQLFNPEFNIEIGCWYLGRAVARWRDYDCCLELALCQYNAGPSRANAWKPETTDGSVTDRIDIDSTGKYVTEIMARYNYYKKNSPFKNAE